MALITGDCTGLSMAPLRTVIEIKPEFLAGPKLQLVLVLTLSLLSALVAVILATKQLTSRFHAPGEAGRLGIRAGVFCALSAGAVFTFWQRGRPAERAPPPWSGHYGRECGLSLRSASHRCFRAFFVALSED